MSDAENKNNEVDDFGDIEKLSDSMVFRIEYLLAGKSFSKMEEIAENLYKYYNDYFMHRIEMIEKSLENVTEEDLEEEAEYNENLKLLYTPTPRLSMPDRFKILELFNRAVTSTENNMRRLDVIPNKNNIFFEETFSKNAVFSDSVIDSIKSRLSYIIEVPDKVYAEQKIELYKKQIKLNNEFLRDKYCFAVSKKVLFENFDKIVEMLKQIKKSGRKIELVIDNFQNDQENTFDAKVPYSYTDDEMKKLYKLYRFRGVVDEIYFSEFYNENFMPTSRDDFWNFDEVAFANVRKNDYVKGVSKLDLSPLQKVLIAHKFVTRLKYSGHANFDERTRTFLTAEHSKTYEDAKILIENGQAFICTGFAQYEKATIDDFGDENIKCRLVAIDLYDHATMQKREESSHLDVLIHLVDEKYGINGYYLCDPTWDIDGNGFAHCLIPVGDIDKFKNRIVVADDGEKKSLKDMIINHSRPDEIETRWNNNKFMSKYIESSPIPFNVIKNALKDMYEKIINSHEVIEGFEIGKNIDAKDCAIMDINDTFHNIDDFDPESSNIAFYKKMRNFFLLRTKHYNGDWLGNWNSNIRNVNFTREDW